MRVQVPEEARHTRFLRAFVNFFKTIYFKLLLFFFQVWPIRDIVVCVREPALITY